MVGLRRAAYSQTGRTAADPRRAPPRGEVWGLHLITATACADLGEVLPGTRDKPVEQLWEGEPVVVDGYLTPSDAPGLGVVLKREYAG
ncbi:MAG: hypothetical protein R2867_28715 [Caldilineaceae bacterium]